MRANVRPGGDNGELLTNDLKQERAVQIHWGKLRQPGVRIEIRAGVDEPRHDGVRVAELSARLLQRCGTGTGLHHRVCSVQLSDYAAAGAATAARA